MFVFKQIIYYARGFYILSLLLLALCLTVVLASAQTSPKHRLTWTTLDNGPAVTQGGTYVLRGTIGQPEAVMPTTGGQYQLQGGFWTPYHIAEPVSDLYLPIITK